MNPIELFQPIPRSLCLSFEEFSYPIASRKYLPIPQQDVTVLAQNIIGCRQSRRSFAQPSEEELSEVLWHTSKVKNVFENGLQHRGAPSAGGIHPIDLLLLSTDSHNAYVYDPIAHAMLILETDEDFLTDRIGQHLMDRFQFTGSGVAVIFMAQFSRTMSRYENGESLVWRDSGALLATFYFVTEMLGLACCGIGDSCDYIIDSVLSSAGILRGVGGCVIGQRAP